MEYAALYLIVAILFLFLFSIERACGMIDESMGFVIVMSVLWPVMLIHIVPFGLKCLFSPETWRD